MITGSSGDSRERGRDIGKSSILISRTRKQNGNGNHSTSRSSLFLPSSINPDTFSPSFDVIWAINNDKERYVGEKNLSLYSYPQMCKINVDRLRPYLKGAPGVNPILSACLYGGISALSTNEGIKELAELKLRFDSAPKNIPGTVSLALGNFLNNFSVDTPKGKQLNIVVPLEHYGMLGRIGGDIGVSNHTLAIIAILYTLARQIQTNESDKEEMEGVIERFYSAVDIRVRGARALMNEFHIPEVEENRRGKRG